MNQIIVIDLGSQLCHLISRRVRQLNVYSGVLPNTVSCDDIRKLKSDGLKGIIISGGPSSIYDEESPGIDKGILDLGVPILGICYGHHLIAKYSGGVVKRNKKKEYGVTDFSLIENGKKSKLFAGLPEKQKIWMNHGDNVESMPDGFTITGSTYNSHIAAFENENKNIYGVQFHIEVTHTEKGMDILKNFVFNICGAEKDWSLSDFKERKVKEIKEQIGSQRAVIGLSGGVDSSTCAALVSEAIGNNLKAIFIDTGFMRLNEPEEIKEAFSEWDIDLKIVDSRKLFIEALKGVTDPEKKRKIIGEMFIREFEREAKKIDAGFLVQGTIYPDIIESGTTKNASVIKSHHNVGGLPEHMDLELCEPLRNLYKDEVRKIAQKIGLPAQMIKRHPFPGPGLAIRIIGECTEKNIDIVKQANHVLLNELEKNNFYDKTWQAFAVLLPIQSVGVQGDARAYKKVIAIRLVDSVDAMTANFTHTPYDLLERISTRITNEVTEIGRVVYDITNKPPGTIEWE